MPLERTIIHLVMKSTETNGEKINNSGSRCIFPSIPPMKNFFVGLNTITSALSPTGVHWGFNVFIQCVEDTLMAKEWAY